MRPKQYILNGPSECLNVGCIYQLETANQQQQEKSKDIYCNIL